MTKLEVYKIAALGSLIWGAQGHPTDTDPHLDTLHECWDRMSLTEKDEAAKITHSISVKYLKSDGDVKHGALVTMIHEVCDLLRSTITREFNMSKETTAKPLTAKQVFKNIKPIDSKNVEVYFDRAFKINSRSKFDGYVDKLDGNLGAFVRVGDNPDIFAVPYRITAAKTSAGESSLRGAFKTRGIATVSIEELKPKK